MRVIERPYLDPSGVYGHMQVWRVRDEVRNPVRVLFFPIRDLILFEVEEARHERG